MFCCLVSYVVDSKWAFKPLAEAKFANFFIVFVGVSPKEYVFQSDATFKFFFQPIYVVVFRHFTIAGNGFGLGEGGELLAQRFSRIPNV